MRYLICEIDEPFIFRCDEGFEYSSNRHDPVSHVYLTFFAIKTCQILHVHVEQPRSDFVNRLDNVSAGTRRVADIDTASYARVHLFYRLEHSQRGGPQLILRPMVVDGNPDIVLLHALLNAGKN